MSLRDEVLELLTMPQSEDGYAAEPVDAEKAIDKWEEENGKVDNLAEGSEAEDIAESIYQHRKFWTDDE